MPAEFDDLHMVTWVDDFGSDRLKKAKLARMLDDCRGVYRAERLEYERPGWDYLDVERIKPTELKARLTKPNNPDEDELDALLLARKEFGDDVLLRRWETECGGGKFARILVENFLGRQAYITVEKYLTSVAAAS